MIFKKQVAVPQEDQEMNFFDHLEALRWHIIKGIIGILIATVIAFLNKDLLFDHIIFGPTKAEFITYTGLCKLSNLLGLKSVLCFENIEFKIINLQLTGQFLVHLKTAFVAGFILGFPYLFWEIWKFVKPALRSTEKNYTNFIVFFASLMFIIGILFGYFLLSPFSIQFFSNYQISESINNNFGLNNYVSFLSMFVLASGILFELPLVVYILSKLGLIGPNDMRSHRRHAFVVILIVSAFITPVDIGTQFLVAVPVYFLYEISILISARIYKQRQKELT